MYTCKTVTDTQPIPKLGELCVGKKKKRKKALGNEYSVKSLRLLMNQSAARGGRDGGGGMV